MEKEPGYNGNTGKSTIGGTGGFSINHMDPEADPYADFFHFSAGNWIRNNPVPPEKSHWGAFEELLERNDHSLRAILERCSSVDGRQPGGVEKALGDLYRSAMDTRTIEKLGFSPIEEQMAGVEKISSVEQLLEFTAELHLQGIYPFFPSFSSQDRKNSSIYAFYMMQGGLTLPNRDYYLEEQFAPIREEYGKHLERMFVLYGEEQQAAERHAGVVLEIESAMAEHSRRQAELRDAEKNYNRFDTSTLDREFPGLGLGRYLSLLGVGPVDYVVIGQPEFFRFLDGLITSRPLDDWKTYLRWKILTDAASFLFSKVEDENFDMFNRKLRGQKEPEPRWKRSVSIVDQCLGEALGKLYVEEHFRPEAREKMSILIQDISSVFRSRLEKMPWMSDETRKRALTKFGRFRAKIGYPKKFRDYSSIAIRPEDFLGNVARCSVFEVRRLLDRVGKPVDRDEWFMSPPTVNAYFSPPDNEIVFPAGILQPPFFDAEMDDAVNYGAIGAVISHEITHGFDDQGRRYDEEGNLKDWWNGNDEANFKDLADRIVGIYGTLEVLPGVNVNGELTLGENIADFGGVSIAYEALQRHLEKNPGLRKEIDGYTPEQRFFISWAQMWRENTLDPEARRRVTIDPHAPNRFRAIIPVYNHPAFSTAFGGNSDSMPGGGSGEKVQIW